MAEEDEIALIRKSLLDDGFAIIKSIVPDVECDRFVSESIKPALDELTGFREDDSSTFEGVEGAMVHNRGKDPIQGKDARWPALMESQRLNGILNALHGSGSWEWLHDDNVGWIHIRFPTKTQEQHEEMNRLPKVADYGWHVDGGHFDFHKYDSPEQSVILLPMVRDVGATGGATKIIRGSQKEVGEYLSYKGREGVHRRMLNEQIKLFLVKAILNKEPSRLTSAEAKKGDVLIIHPFLVHTASVNTIGQPWRITFNMGTRWKNRASLLPKVTVSDDSHVLKYGEFIFLHFKCGAGCLRVCEDDAVVARRIPKVPGDYLVRHRVKIISAHDKDEKKLGDRVAVGDLVHLAFKTEEVGEGTLTFLDGKLSLNRACEPEKNSLLQVKSYSATEGANIFFGSSSFFLMDFETGNFLDTEGEAGGEVGKRWQDMGEWQELYVTK